MSAIPQLFDWNQIRAFLTTVETGSLSAAARTLGLTQPTLSRQIAALEADLDLLLFERVGRRLQLTAAGRQLAGHVREMGAAADRVAIAATGQSQAVEGLVRITASDIIAGYVLPPILERISGMAPGVTVEVIASNAVNDLMRREADIAIRHVRPEQPDLIARRCPDAPISLYASSAFLDRFGRCERLEDWAKAPFIGFSQEDGLVAEISNRGIPVTRANFKWFCTSANVGLQLIRQGLGLGITFCQAADAYSELENILPHAEPLRAPMWLVAHRELHTSRRVRIVYNALVEGLSRATPENPG